MAEVEAKAGRAIPRWLRNVEKVRIFAASCRDDESGAVIAKKLGMSTSNVTVAMSNLRKSVELGCLTEKETEYAKNVLELWNSRTVSRSHAMDDDLCDDLMGELL